jgi:hypothetical protein
VKELELFFDYDDKDPEFGGINYDDYGCSDPHCPVCGSDYDDYDGWDDNEDADNKAADD